MSVIGGWKRMVNNAKKELTSDLKNDEMSRDALNEIFRYSDGHI